MNTQIGKTTLGGLLTGIIVLVIMLLVIVFCVVMAIITGRARRIQKKEIKRLKANGLMTMCNAFHFTGLPLAEDTRCRIMTYSDRIEFQSGTTHINLNRSKITDMCIKTETEIQQQYVSSLGGAVGGAVLFGPIGAMIGGRAKKKESMTVQNFLIITYLSDDEKLTHLCFDVGGHLSAANKIIREFKQLNSNGITNISL